MRRFTWLIVLLSILQGLAFASLSAAHGAVGQGVWAASAGRCDGHTPNGGGQGDESGAHSGCCIFCASSAFDGLSRLASILPKYIAFPTAPFAVGTTRSLRDDRRGRPPGWASSWSSQAPPFFS
ncbi:MAG: hypothetical protein C3F11_15455 [Methylocystaceae bacterium]|nr:MAG: hypothetical protein C3F11_15455 [Methylocystaceae bacterium]